MFALVSLVAENGRRPVRLSQHGAPIGRGGAEGRLPFLPMRCVPALRRNGFVSVEPDGTDVLVGLVRASGDSRSAGRSTFRPSERQHSRYPHRRVAVPKPVAALQGGAPPM